MKVGAYELLDELGRGGMGSVHRARHEPTGALRAVKLLAGALDPESVARFQREARALARVAGRGVVAVHETGVEQGRLWFAMDLLGGGSLKDRLRARGRLPWREALALAAELARVLERCHAASVVHRDVKPANVLLDEEGHPWLADFGCVRDLGASRLTETGTSVGTLGYSAPEQLEAEPVDGRADVFALGVVLHELVAGTPPFKGETVLAQLAQRRKPRAPLTAQGAPAELDRVLDRALAPAIGDRLSAAAFARELGSVLDGTAAKEGSHAPRALALAFVTVLAVGLAVAAAVGRTTPGSPLEPRPATRPTPPSPPPPASSDDDPFRAALVDRATARDRVGALMEKGHRPSREVAPAVADLWREAIDETAQSGRGESAQGARGFALQFRHFATALEACGDQPVAYPWTALRMIRDYARPSRATEDRMRMVLAPWPGNPTLLLFQTHDATPPSPAEIRAAIGRFRTAPAVRAGDLSAKERAIDELLERGYEVAARTASWEEALWFAKEWDAPALGPRARFAHADALVRLSRWDEALDVTAVIPAGPNRDEAARQRLVALRLNLLASHGRLDEGRDFALTVVAQHQAGGEDGMRPAIAYVAVALRAAGRELEADTLDALAGRSTR